MIEPLFRVPVPPGTYTRGNIQIITPSPAPSPAPSSVPVPVPVPLPPPAIPEPVPVLPPPAEPAALLSPQEEGEVVRSFDRGMQPAELVVEEVPPVPIDEVVFGLEKYFTEQFENYLWKSTGRIRLKTVTEIRNTLLEIEREAGIKPALLYVSFIPSKPEAGKDDSDELQLVMVTGEGNPILKRVPGATRGKVSQVAAEFRRQVTNIRELQSAKYLPSAQQLYKWLVAPLEAELGEKKIENLAFIMDVGLRSLPVAALHDGQQFLVGKYSVSLMPSLSLTDTRYVDVRTLQILAMGAEEFPDASDLPAVPVELSAIAGRLWEGEAFLNQAFTADNLKSQRESFGFRMVHLATHGEFRSGEPNNSYIQLFNTKVHMGDELRNLQLSYPPVELLVLSACRTALGDEGAELGESRFCRAGGGEVGARQSVVC
jgi:CHAT domain-containing protein